MSEPLPQVSPFQWQQDSWQQLLQQSAQGRLPHALMLAGPKGVGKRQFAAAFVAYHLCTQQQGGVACGQCQSCHLLSTGGHPDVCFPATSGKSEQLRVNEIRQVVDFCTKTAQLGDKRVVLLQPACHMNISAQNALLKTLEEPGANTLLLLVADSPQLLLPTIKSRCQQHVLPFPNKQQARDWLAAEGLDAAAAEGALAATAGAPLLACELAKADWFQQRSQWMQQLLALSRGQGSISAVSSKLARFPQSDMLQALAHWGHQGLRAGFLREKPQDPALKTLIAMTHQIGARSISLWYGEVQQAASRLTRSANLNKELQLDRLLWQLTPEGVASTLGKNNN